MSDGAMCHYCRKYRCICYLRKDIIEMFHNEETIAEICRTLDTTGEIVADTIMDFLDGRWNEKRM